MQMNESAETSNAARDHIHGPVLLLIRGLPGSGKTYLANALQAMLGADKAVLLDPDAIDFASEAYQTHTTTLTTAGIEEKFHPYRFLLANLRESIVAHKIILWNQPFSDLGGFQRTLENVRIFAAEHNMPLPILLVEIEISPHAAKARVAQRIEQGGHGPSPNRFDGYVQTHTSFADKGVDYAITVNGEDDVTTSANTVIRALHDLLGLDGLL
jgi:predicted kinase